VLHGASNENLIKLSTTLLSALALFSIFLEGLCKVVDILYRQAHTELYEQFNLDCLNV